MNLFPKMIRQFLTVDNLPYIIAAVVVLGILVLVAFLVYYFIRKRKNADGKQAKPVEEKVKQKGMPASSLAKIWKEFLKEIPFTVRPNIIAYEHFIVFGEAGSGKSALIDNYTDWQGHARQFYPSYTTNPLLQIYLGSKVLVQEIPAALLEDTSEYARRALLKLWKPLFRRRPPTVVIVLNGMDLQTDESEYLEYLKQKAQIVRGKINLLGQICKKPIKVRIALTHLDQIEGYLEFSRFLSQSNIPLKLDFHSGTDVADISGCLEQYEEHLSRALQTLPADKYLRAVTFMRQAPKLFQDLSVFVKFLQNSDPLSLEPEVANFYLTSQTEEATPILNPFAPSLTAQEIKKIDPHFKHRVAAAAIGIAGLAFLCTAYFHGRALIAERNRELAKMEASHPFRYDQKLHELLPSVYRQEHPLVKILPDFFPEINREITRRFMAYVRKFYLLPELDRLSAEMMTKPHVAFGQLVTISSLDQQFRGKIEDTQDRAIYLLALIYATKNNELGRLIQQNLASWSQILNLPKIMIEDYANNNESSSDVYLDSRKLSFHQSKGTLDDPQSWMVYFTEISRLYQQPFLSSPDLEKLQRDTDSFIGVIQQMEFYDLTVKIAKLLTKEVPSGINLDMIVAKESEIRQESVKGFLKFIKNSSINYPQVTDGLGFTGLLENLKVMLDYKGAPGEQSQFHFLFNGQEFNFSPQQWSDLLNRSRIALFLRDFVNHYKHLDGMLFFPSDKEFNDLVMNSSNDGQFLFIGHARIDGRFTKEAIEKRVRPILTTLPAVINSLPIAPQDKAYFSNFLFKEVDIYGRRYAQAYRKYYMGFDIKAGSPGALRFVLSQMVLPSSPLREVLATIKDNTNIDPGNNEYLQAFVLNMAEFDFIKHLMGDQKGAFPEIDKYKALLEQMLADIQDQQEPVAKKDKEESYPQFKSRLTPLARISFAIFNNEKDSYLSLVRQWLDSVAVPRRWQDIFLAPVWQAYFLGATEVETEVGKIWTELWQADIQPLYSKFPFTASSGEDVSVDALRNATTPTGHFWQTYQAMLSPFCTQDGRRWKKRNGPFNVPKLPNNLLPTLNAVTQLSSVLWDKEGKERPLEFMVRPKPLPAALPNEPMASLSYIQAGDCIVFGFNQKPSWKKLKADWHNQYWAAVGVEFATKDKSVKIKRTVEVPASNWGFYHLLQKAEGAGAVDRPDCSDKGKSAGRCYTAVNGKKAGDSKTVRWAVTSPATSGKGSSSIDVIFDIQNDPWAVFKLPR